MQQKKGGIEKEKKVTTDIDEQGINFYSVRLRFYFLRCNNNGLQKRRSR